MLAWGSYSTTGAVAQLWDGHLGLPRDHKGLAGPCPRRGCSPRCCLSPSYSNESVCWYVGAEGSARHEHVEAVYCQGCCRPCSVSPNQLGRCGCSVWGQWGPSLGWGWATAGRQGWLSRGVCFYHIPSFLFVSLPSRVFGGVEITRANPRFWGQLETFLLSWIAWSFVPSMVNGAAGRSVRSSLKRGIVESTPQSGLKCAGLALLTHCFGGARG